MNYSQRPQTELQKLPAGPILPSFVSESTVNILESHFTGREDKGKRVSGRGLPCFLQEEISNMHIILVSSALLLPLIPQ